MVIKMSFDFHVHGLWILGALFFFVAGIMAGNLQWVMGTTEVSFGISIVLIFLLFLIAAMFWISAAVNARHEEFHSGVQRKSNVYVNVYRNGHLVRKEEVPSEV
jgi:Na+-transporting methylmalonyl-CoA/oxaloacetate decarboxylase gamma subunit